MRVHFGKLAYFQINFNFLWKKIAHGWGNMAQALKHMLKQMGRGPESRCSSAFMTVLILSPAREISLYIHEFVLILTCSCDLPTSPSKNKTKQKTSKQKTQLCRNQCLTYWILDILKILDVQKQCLWKLFNSSKDCTSTGLNRATDSGIMDAKVGPRAIQLKYFGGNSLVVNSGDSWVQSLVGELRFYKLKHKQKQNERVCAKWCHLTCLQDAAWDAGKDEQWWSQGTEVQGPALSLFAYELLGESVHLLKLGLLLRLSHFSRVWLCDLKDYSPPGSSVHGILQARILEWVAMPSTRGSSRPRGQNCISCVSCIDRWVLYH